MPTPLITRPELAPAAAFFAKACQASRDHSKMAGEALQLYGDQGAQISGCVRDHFPAATKEALRTLARQVSTYSDSAYAARPPRVRTSTMGALGREIATRDGSGFYGPQPYRRELLPIIFRAERSGDAKGEVTAVFPTLPHDYHGRYFTVYAHLGQHSGGSFGWLRSTRAAKPAEYADLLAELRRIYERGDDAVTLQVCQRMTAAHRRAFAAAVADYQRATRGDSAWVQGRIAEAAEGR